jgi:hypothetical protein
LVFVIGAARKGLLRGIPIPVKKLPCHFVGIEHQMGIGLPRCFWDIVVASSLPTLRSNTFLNALNSRPVLTVHELFSNVLKRSDSNLRR